jgi:hypothetical protein
LKAQTTPTIKPTAPTTSTPLMDSTTETRTA